MTILRLEHFRVAQLEAFDLCTENEIVCLSGPSGSGKTLLLRAIADLIEHGGEAWLDDMACSRISPVKWRSLVGYLPAESAWWYDSVGEHFINRQSPYLEALNMPADSLNWQVSRCSSGERQRLALARLLQNQPRALLLDEATASLDPVSVQAVETLIKEYVQQNQATVIWVSHDAAQAKRVRQRQLEIQGNRVIEVAL